MNQAQLLDYAQTCLILVLRLSLIPIIVAIRGTCPMNHRRQH